METFVNFATLCDDDNLNYQEFNLVKANHSHAIQNKEVYVFSAVGTYKYFVFIFNKLTNKKPGIREPEIKDFCYPLLGRNILARKQFAFFVYYDCNIYGAFHIFCLTFQGFEKIPNPVKSLQLECACIRCHYIK